MEVTKEMVLIPSELAETIQSSTTRGNATHKVLSELDAEIQSVLYKDNLSDEQKISLYNQTLQKYMQLEQHAPLPEPMPVKIHDQVSNLENGGLSAHQSSLNSKEEPSKLKIEANQSHVNLKENALKLLPVTIRKKASLLIDHLAKQGQAGSSLNNERGELIFNGRVIPGSNLVDLLYDVMKERKDVQPIGWQQFLRVLVDANAPESLIANVNRRELFHRMKTKNVTSPAGAKSKLLPTVPTRVTQSTPKRKRSSLHTQYLTKKLKHWQSF